MSLTINESGKAITETQEGVTVPVDYSFECVNDFVHSHETQYEELQCLALGMANYIERLEKTKCTEVSSFLAGRAFNDVCRMVGGRCPDAVIQEDAPEAYAFFMKLM